MQGVENSELVYAPARETTLFHRSARKAGGGPEKNTAARSIAVRARRVMALKKPQLLEAAGRRGLLRRGGQLRASPRSYNAVLTDRPRTHKYQLIPPSARLREPGMTPLCAVAPRTISDLKFSKNGPPRTKIKNLVRGSPCQDLLRGSATR